MKDTLKFYKDIYEPLFETGYTKKSNRAAPAFEALEKWQKENNFEVKSVVDVGCAWGKALKYWKNRKAEDIVGVDVSPLIVNRLKKKGWDAILASATDLSKIEDGRFDLYMSTDCYEHLTEEDLHHAIEEAKRVSKEYIMIRAHPTQDKRGYLHLTIWSNEQWKQFFEDHDLEVLSLDMGDGLWHYKNTHLMRKKNVS